MAAVRRAALVKGASYGVGAATMLALARGGYDVGVTAPRLEYPAETVKKLEAAGTRAMRGAG